MFAAFVALVVCGVFSVWTTDWLLLFPTFPVWASPLALFNHVAVPLFEAFPPLPFAIPRTELVPLAAPLPGVPLDELFPPLNPPLPLDDPRELVAPLVPLLLLPPLVAEPLPWLPPREVKASPLPRPWLPPRPSPLPLPLGGPLERNGGGGG